MWKDMVLFRNWPCYALCCFSTGRVLFIVCSFSSIRAVLFIYVWFVSVSVYFVSGYFIYDSLDIIWARRIREKWEILVHHTAVSQLGG